MGLRYLGPIDGHDLPLLINSLEFAKTCDKPVVLHVLTKKGKGYDVAIQQPEKFHGTGPYDIQTGASPAPKPGTAPAWQDVFGADDGEAVPEGQFGGGHHGGDAERARA